jgi:hypothetical protein
MRLAPSVLLRFIGETTDRVVALAPGLAAVCVN